MGVQPEIWAINRNPKLTYIEDYLAGFLGRGCRGRLVTLQEAEAAGKAGPPPAFVLDFNYHGETALVLSRQKVPYVAVVYDMWYYPTSMYNPDTKGHLREVFVFTCDAEQLEAYERAGVTHAEYLPLAANTDRFRPLHGEPRDAARYRYRVGFYGTPMLGTPNNGYLTLSKHLDEQERSPSPKLTPDQIRRTRLLLETIVRVQSEDLFRYRLPEIVPEMERKYRITPVEKTMTPKKQAWVLMLSDHISMIQRIAVVKRLAPLGITVFGPPEWKRVEAPGLAYGGPVDYASALPGVINDICINVGVEKSMGDRALGQRIFEVLACGGFLLSNRTSVQERLFEDGKDLVLYDTLDDLEEKARYYLTHDRHREEIAARGRRTVAGHHGTALRAEHILEVLHRHGVIAREPEGFKGP
jgi:spore maturation protein CgeB